LTELLHSTEALTDVATSFAEPARSWARALLAVWHNALPAGLPQTDVLWDPVVARRPPGLATAALAALQAEQPPSDGLAATLAFAKTWGVDLGDPSAIAAAARRHLAPGCPANLHLVRLIADREPLTPELLQLAASTPNADSPQAQASLAALVLRYAAVSGAEHSVFASVLAPFDGDGLYRVLDFLGLGLMPPPPSTDPDHAVAFGAELAQTAPPQVTARGGRKGRARAWLKALTEGTREPLWLAAAAALDRDPPPALTALVLAQASHNHAYRPRDPVSDVVDLYAGYRPATLTAARETGLGGAAPRALQAFQDGNLAVAPLLIDADPETFAPDALAAAAGWPTMLTIGAAIATLPALSQDPGTLLGPMLARPSDREGALAVAAWSPTPATLEALLRMPVPHDPQQRVDLAQALASMGTRDAAAQCRAILAVANTPAHPRILAALDALHLP